MGSLEELGFAPERTGTSADPTDITVPKYDLPLAERRDPIGCLLN